MNDSAIVFQVPCHHRAVVSIRADLEIKHTPTVDRAAPKSAHTNRNSANHARTAPIPLAQPFAEGEAPFLSIEDEARIPGRVQFISPEEGDPTNGSVDPY